MKFTFFTLFIALFSCSLLSAQQYNGQVTVTIVEAGQVPTAVVDAFAADFPGLVVRQWKKQEYAGNQAGTILYLASANVNGQNLRARYTPEGQGLSAYTSYRPQSLPAAILETLGTDYAGYTTTGAAKVSSLQRDWEAFHLRLRKGGTKLTLWMTEDGTVIQPQNIPQEAEQDFTE